MPSGPSVLSAAPELLARHAQRLDALLPNLRARWPDAPISLLDAMLYSLEAGGKRIRPALVFESFIACDGQPERASRVDAAALAMEMVHTFSLVHDDLPAMDDDDLRRGRPTCHKVFGEALAILAGDALLAGALELLADTGDPTLVTELARATGPSGMVGGQVLDIATTGTPITPAELAKMHSLKTGALLVAACRLGACAAGAGSDQLAAVTKFAAHIGLAFQIVDDLLDVSSTPEQLGKTPGKDAAQQKNTYPRLHGIEPSKAKAQAELHSALIALSPLGPPADGLRTLAHFVVSRVS